MIKTILSITCEKTIKLETLRLRFLLPAEQYPNPRTKNSQAEGFCHIVIRSQLQTGFSRYPRCGEIVCGVWPHIVSEGHLVASTVMAQGGASGGGNPFPRAGTFAASEEFYHFGAYTIYQGFASDIEAGSKAAQGAKVYLRCSTSTRCSTNAKGGAAE